MNKLMEELKRATWQEWAGLGVVIIIFFGICELVKAGESLWVWRLVGLNVVIAGVWCWLDIRRAKKDKKAREIK